MSAIPYLTVCYLGSDRPATAPRYQSNYEAKFVQLKPDKKLKWLPQLGTVNLTLDLADRSLTLDVSPLQASIIELFSAQGELERALTYANHTR